MGMTLTLKLLLSVMVASLLHCAAGLNCMQEGDPLQTEPREINTTPGSRFSLTCRLDPRHPAMAGVSARDLYFTRDFPSRSESVPADHYQFSNTTITLEDSLQVAVHYQYTCRVRRRRPLCNSSVNVGSAPMEVEEFRCVSNNWEDISCTWREPYNAVYTQHRLLYRAGPDSGGDGEEDPVLRDSTDEDDTDSRHRHHHQQRWAACPQYKVLRDHRAMCTISGRTQPIYRHGLQWYNFTMKLENALGERMQTLPPVNNFAIVLPSAPLWVNSSTVTTDSFQLDFQVGLPMAVFPLPLQYRITYTSPWDIAPKEVGSPVRESADDSRLPRSVLVTGLVPYTSYNVSVQLRSSAAPARAGWSAPGRHTVRTQAALPGRPPRLDPGSFQLLDAGADRTVYLYWRQIAAPLQHGPDFVYCAQASPLLARQKGVLLRPDLVTPAYARFRGAPLGELQLSVRACNRLGASEEQSSLIVPDSKHVPAPPHTVTLVLAGDGTHQLLWKYGAEAAGKHRQPDWFTVFWCQQRADWPYQCQGQLGWTHVSGSARNYSVTLPTESHYQLAVAANFQRRGRNARAVQTPTEAAGGPVISSGMAWARCTLLNSIDSEQTVELAVREYGADHVTLAWTSDCSNWGADLASQYVVYVCKQRNNACEGDERRVETSGLLSDGLRLDQLDPYTSYRVSVALVSRATGKEGPRSSPRALQTLEAAPSTPPIVTKVSAPSNTSIAVQWSPPARANGLLRHYLLRVAGPAAPQAAVRVSPGQQLWTVSELLPDSTYGATVTACTRVGCGPASPPATVRTLPGVPGRMSPPLVKLLNGSAAELRWTQPVPRGAPELLYQLQLLTQLGNNGNGTQLLPLDGGSGAAPLQSVVALPACSADDAAGALSHQFRVRAVAQLASGEQLPGSWSEPAEQLCGQLVAAPGQRLAGPLAAGCIAAAVVALAAFCLCRRTKRHWLKMRDIGVNLPAGLDKLPAGHVANGALNAAESSTIRLVNGVNNSRGEELSSSAGVVTDLSGEESSTSGLWSPPLSQGRPHRRSQADSARTGSTVTDPGSKLGSRSASTDSSARELPVSGSEMPQLAPYVQLAAPQPPYSLHSLRCPAHSAPYTPHPPAEQTYTPHTAPYAPYTQREAQNIPDCGDGDSLQPYVAAWPYAGDTEPYVTARPYVAAEPYVAVDPYVAADSFGAPQMMSSTEPHITTLCASDSSQSYSMGAQSPGGGTSADSAESHPYTKAGLHVADSHPYVQSKLDVDTNKEESQLHPADSEQHISPYSKRRKPSHPSSQRPGSGHLEPYVRVAAPVPPYVLAGPPEPETPEEPSLVEPLLKHSRLEPEHGEIELSTLEPPRAAEPPKSEPLLRQPGAVEPRRQQSREVLSSDDPSANVPLL